MKHETFKNAAFGEAKDAAFGEAFEAIEGRILPSLTMLIEQASTAEPGIDADAHAAQLRALARQIEELTRQFDSAGIRSA